MSVVETERLIVRELSLSDAAFLLELMNEAGWHRFIGDRGIRTVEAAATYIESAVLASYERHGHGLCCVTLKGSGEPIGICGLVRRESLDGPDLGFAFLERHQGAGLALEAARAVVAHAREALGITRLLAVTSPANEPSIRLLAKMGFVREGGMRGPGEAAERLLFTNQPRGASEGPRLEA
jgi:RimJ/RimL family protein N-acetyltransferase